MNEPIDILRREITQLTAWVHEMQLENRQLKQRVINAEKRAEKAKDSAAIARTKISSLTGQLLQMKAQLPEASDIHKMASIAKQLYGKDLPPVFTELPILEDA